MTKLHWRYRRKLDAVLDGKIPESCRYKRGSCATYREIIERIMQNGKRKVYVAGGLVRDLVSGIDIEKADVDIKFGVMGKYALKSIFDDLGVAMRIDAKPIYTYFFVGCDPDNQLEGHMILPKKPVDIESPSNSLMVDLSDMTLIDPTGVGVEDARNKIWRIPPGVDRNAWFTGPRLLWRMMKFRLRGYKVPPDDIDFIYKKFAATERRGKIRASDYRNLINQVPDPADAIGLLVKDASERDVADDVVLIASKLIKSEEVWKKIESHGNIPFQTICDDMREAIIRRKEEDKREKRRKIREKK